ncbi:MAG: hypothetical protein IPL08_00195 [Saprospiraceae bacterium]|nr:hypothetical protein [Saprospiraceae bacterium]
MSLEGKESNYLHKPVFLSNFVRLDDMDILWMIKRSVDHTDKIFGTLCKNLLDRKLPQSDAKPKNPSYISKS